MKKNKKQTKNHRSKKKTLSGFSRRSSNNFKNRKDKKKIALKSFQGKFSLTRHGFGFVSFDNSESDVFIPASKTGGAQNGDTVSFVITRCKSGAERAEGEITSIIERNSALFTGRIEESFSNVRRAGRITAVKSYVFYADCVKQLSFPVKISRALAGGAQDRDRVAVKIIKYPENGRDAIGKVVKIFGKCDTPASLAESVLFLNSIPSEFDEETLLEAKNLHYNDADISNRLDLREETVFTIDSEYAKDLDDAISVKKLNDGFILGVHIADVSEYVKPGTAIDCEARRRGTSVYYPGNVVPMLPPELSNGLCSLNRESDKLTLSAIIRLNAVGEIVSCEVSESIISSKARGVYSELNEILNRSADPSLKKKYPKEVLSMLRDGVKLYKILKRRSDKRGCFELSSGDAFILLDENGYPCDIVRNERGVCERLIEQFMLCANEAVARLAAASSIPGVFRIHEKPDSEKSAALLSYVENLGIDLRKYKFKADSLSPKDMQKILKQADAANAGRAVSEVLLRSLMKAKYMPVPSPHYGLALDYYSHFTSPIRRYADLALHRSLKDAIQKRHGSILYSASDKLGKYTPGAGMSSAAECANEGELRALAAEREIDDIYKAYYMKKHIGEEFEAFIISVLPFGFFAELDNTCEGLVPVSSLEGCYCYSEADMTLKNGSEKKFSVGMRVRVRVESVDIAAGKTTFSLAEQPGIDKKNNP